MSRPIVPFVAVGGTHAWSPSGLRGQWHQPGSAWSAFMASQDMVHACARPFVWSSNLDGLLPWRKLATWAAAGDNLFAYCVPPLAPERQIPPLELHVVSHSHGRQVVMIAAALGLKIQTFVDVCGPVRDDVNEAYGELARENIAYWIHVHSDHSDRMQWLGGLGDGAFGIVRTCPLATKDGRGLNVYLPQAGHSGVLTAPAWFAAWGPWLDTMRQRHGRDDGR